MPRNFTQKIVPDYRDRGMWAIRFTGRIGDFEYECWRPLKHCAALVHFLNRKEPVDGADPFEDIWLKPSYSEVPLLSKYLNRLRGLGSKAEIAALHGEIKDAWGYGRAVFENGFVGLSADAPRFLRDLVKDVEPGWIEKISRCRWCEKFFSALKKGRKDCTPVCHTAWGNMMKSWKEQQGERQSLAPIQLLDDLLNSRPVPGLGLSADDKLKLLIQGRAASKTAEQLYNELSLGAKKIIDFCAGLLYRVDWFKKHGFHSSGWTARLERGETAFDIAMDLPDFIWDKL